MMDRKFVLSLAITCLAIGTPTLQNASAAPPTAAKALALEPVQKGDVVYERVPAAEVNRCVVSDINSEGMTGWEVSAADGTLLRRFADTNGDKRIDLWCYFQFGIEVYRDIDGDFNGKADQFRWLGTAGTRWAIDRDEDKKIDGWKQISAEEVSAEIVAALRDADARRFANVLATTSELKSLGLGKAKRAELERRADRAANDFAAFARKQTAIGGDATWLQFAAPAPGVVPAGTQGSTSDLLVYENVVAMYEDGEQSGQLMVGSLVKVGDRWRAIDLPNVGAPGEALSRSSGIFFTPAGGPTTGATAGDSSEIQALVADLETIDQQLATADKKDAPKLNAQRADLVEELITASRLPEDRAAWTRQLVDTVGVAVQNGDYPDGMSRLRSVARKFAVNDKQLAAYTDYQAIQTEYVVRQQTPKADFEKIQEWYHETLGDFAKRYPKTNESALAMLQLALSKEFEEKEKEALSYYKTVSAEFRGTEAGEKAAGAVRRLESVGQRIELEGSTIGGKQFKLSQLRGRPVIIHYWATWCEPCKSDMKLLARLQSRYRRAGLTLVGVNVDANRADAESFIQKSRLPWTQLFEDGGLESSPLAKAFGVQTLPTMMLIDAKGMVVRHNVRSAELDEEIDEMLKKK
ncbi:MAG: TlpA disulfide reductase family protein [Planctomycetota bacterium]